LLLAASLLASLAVAALLIGSRLMSPEPKLGRLVATGDMTAARDGHTATLLTDGRVLLVGGDDSQPTAELYDPATGTFTRTDSLSTAQRFGMAAALLRDGRVLIVGGTNMEGDDVTKWPLGFGEVYDPITGRFSRTGPMVQPRQYLWSALTLPDGRVLVAGGDFPDAPAGATSAQSMHLSSVELYDPETGEFVPGGSLLVPRSAHSLSLLPDGRVLFAGGWGPDGPIASAEIYDPATGTSIATGEMSSARASHAAVALEDGRVVLVGGDGPCSATTCSAARGAAPDVLVSAEIFDPTSGSFQPAGSLITERSGAGAVLLGDGRILVAGGHNRDGDPRTVEVYDPATGSSEVVGRIKPGQDNGNSFSVSSTLLADGSVLLAGGNGSRAERFDPTLPSEPAEPLPGPAAPVGFLALEGPGAGRTGHTATRLADGRVLIAGGTDGADGPLLDSAEIFDPGTGRTLATGSMAAPRAGHVAALLHDGRILVASGLAGADTSKSWPTMELYDPATGTFTAGQTFTVADDIDVARSPRRRYGVSFEGSPSAIALPDGRVVVVGWDPASAAAPQQAVQIFDPVTGDLEPVDLPAGVLAQGVQGALLLADGRVLIFDGSHESIQAQTYDPVRDEWEQVGSTTGRLAFSATSVADRVLITGGKIGSHSSDDESLATIETWDGATGAFSGGSPLLSARVGHTATLLPDGRVLIVGGRAHRHGGDGTTIVPEAYPGPELWDPKSGTSSRAGTMAASRSGHTATLLDDGRVLVVGGVTRLPDRDIPEAPVGELYVGLEGAP
jgi:hypothetical protein